MNKKHNAREITVEHIQSNDNWIWVRLSTEYETREVCYQFDVYDETWFYADGENEPAMHNELISLFHNSLDSILETVRNTGGRVVLKI